MNTVNQLTNKIKLKKSKPIPHEWCCYQYSEKQVFFYQFSFLSPILQLLGFFHNLWLERN